MQRLTFVFALILLASAARAQDGQRLADACLTCHGMGGGGSGAIPGIAGQDAEAMAAALAGMRDGAGKPTIMGRLMRGYSDAEIAAIAAYLAGLK